jgi:hypothetical protein
MFVRKCAPSLAGDSGGQYPTGPVFGGQVTEFRQPFDLLASTAAAHRELVTAGASKEAVFEEILPLADGYRTFWLLQSPGLKLVLGKLEHILSCVAGI